MSENYFYFTTKSRLDKAINTLIGILEGISADKTIEPNEFELLSRWVSDNNILVDRHPYNEFIPKLIDVLADGELDQDELSDMLYLCNQLRSNEYYDLITADLQRLQGMMAAIASDGVISEIEATNLHSWIEEHAELSSCWPYDELNSLLTSALADHRIDPKEHDDLLQFFASFSVDGISLISPKATIKTLTGICAVTPEIIFDSHRFCFTGESTRQSRDEMQIMVLDRGGLVVPAPSAKLNYLIVGSNGNPCWAYACYGRKIEQAMQFRRNGAKILIVHENDFFDAL